MAPQGRKIAIAALVVLSLLTLALDAAGEHSGEGSVAPNAKLIPYRNYSKDVSPKSRGLYNGGSLNMASGEYAAAIELLQGAVEESRGNVDAWDHLGICYRRTRQFDKAIEAYETSISINPANPVPYSNLGLIYFTHKGEFEKALGYYKKTIELDPSDPEGFYGIGQVFQSIRDLDHAIENYLKAVELYNKRGSRVVGDAYYALGISYAAKEPPEIDQAVKYFREAKQYSDVLAPRIRSFIDSFLNKHK